MKQRNAFLRLWDYLRHYKGALFFAIFLKVLSSVMSVLEPFVLGLAITELTANLIDMAKGIPGAHIDTCAACFTNWAVMGQATL